MRVFLIRHGETALNAAGLLRGQLDVPLNATGEAEAAALGHVFSGVSLSAVVSSPLSRAADTARAVATAAAAPLRFDDRLRDRFYGEWAGQTLEQIEARFGSIDSAPFVETWPLLKARTEEAFLEATAVVSRGGMASGDSMAGVALVAHDAVLRALLGGLLPALSPARLDLPTGSWSELTPGASGHRWRVVHIGELPQSGRRPATSTS